MQVPIELRTWEQFLAVAEHLHFGRAARALGMTQPPLTQAIQKLEDRLGVSVFERNRRSVSLTPSGAALIDGVRQLLRSAEELPSLARAADSGEAGTLHLGFVSTVGFAPLPEWLRSFRAAYPNVLVQLHEATCSAQLERLADGNLDAGFIVHAPGMTPDLPQGVIRTAVGAEALCLALPRKERSSLERLSAKELLTQPLIVFPRQHAPSLYDSIFAYLHRHGVTPSVTQEAIQMQTIVNLVSAGMGIALVPKVVSRFRRPGVFYQPLPRHLGSAPRCETSLLIHANATPTARRFLEHVSA